MTTLADVRPVEKARQQMEDGRERLAEEVFSLKAVLDRVTEAARLGFDSVGIIPPRPVSLATTTTAKATLEALKDMGFTRGLAEEVTTPAEDPKNPTGIRQEGKLLVVKW